MNSQGRVISIHTHPKEPGEPMVHVALIELTENGIVQDNRYFARTSYGRPSKRQVSLIEREQIAEHAATLGLPSLGPGVVRSNIETEGINLIDLIGRQVQVGSAVLEFVEPRTPCAKMDEIASGLRALMENRRQGVIARVVLPGTVRLGDPVKAYQPSLSDAAREQVQNPIFEGGTGGGPPATAGS